jgi:acyl-CoA dehydrogenase
MQIGKFEGVRERLARIAMNAHMMNATRVLTCGAIDAGEHPSVASAIAKAYMTEGMRTSINDAMDIVAGAAICRGPRNMFARAYNGIPIGITVEGSNILTRSLIVFGQGAIRCHPYLQDEVAAIGAKDVKAFDKAFFGHIRHVAGNALRALGLGITGAYGTFSPHRSVTRHYRRMTRLSAAFALLADLGLITLGGSLKRKEYLSGRYADALAWLYLGSAVLKQAHDAGYPAASKPLTDMVMRHATYQIEQALLGVIQNLPNRLVALVGYLLTFPHGMRYALPDDHLTDKVVDALLDPTNGVREKLAGDIYVPEATEDGIGKLEATLAKVRLATPIKKKLMTALKDGTLKKAPPVALAEAALKAGIINAKEHKLLANAAAAQDDFVQVDYYSPEDYKKLR